MLRYTSIEWDNTDQESPCKVPFSLIPIRGVHEAGVTAIMPLPFFVKDYGRAVITGSYDDHIRVLIIHDLDKTYGLKRVELVLEENLGGGVWRLDLVSICDDDKNTKIRVLASCMHAGARLLELEVQNGETWSCKALAQFEEHESMNYGSDFMREAVEGDEMKFISTSFYDKRLCLWQYKG